MTDRLTSPGLRRRRISTQGALRRAFGEPLFCSVLAFITIATLLGGAEVRFGIRSVALSVASTLWLVAFFVIKRASFFDRIPVAARAGFVILAVIPLLQIVPLPSFIWQLLPGQNARLATLTVAGLQTYWQPLSLTPIMTSYSAVIISALITATIALIDISEVQFRLICIAVVGFVGFGVLAGLVQVSSAGEYPRFHADADFASLIGLYANKNHMGLVMACSIAVAAYVTSTSQNLSPMRNRFFFAYWAAIVLALPLTNSRAGFVIGSAVSLVTAFPYLRNTSARTRLGIFAGLAMTALLLTFVPMPGNFVARFSEVADDLRWTMLSHSLTMVRSYWLFGSGVGSFADVFITIEQREWLFPTYVNNVHNDYVQLLIEFGIGGVIAVALVAVGAFMKMFFRQSGQRRIMSSSEIMGLLICGAFAVHSIVDYPLRRPAAAIVFALGIAAIFRQSDRGVPPVEHSRVAL